MAPAGFNWENWFPGFETRESGVLWQLAFRREVRDRLKCHMKWGTELERMIINIITRYSVHIQHTYCV